MSKILFLFEGDAYEPEIFTATVPVMAPRSNFSRSGDGVVCEYGTHIYSLYSKLKADDGLDLVELLLSDKLEKYPRLREAVGDNEYPQEVFEAIYLLFDYDGHVNMPRNDDGSHLDGDTALREMLDFFDDATENGKLLISYPMVEAIKHLSEPPAAKADIVTAKCKGPHCPNLECESRGDRNACPPVRKYYKSLVNNLHPSRSRTETIAPREWSRIFTCHIKVAQLMCSSASEIASQQDIFDVQLRDYISLSCPQVAVLSSFPFLYVDLIGEAALDARLGDLAL